MGNQHAAGLYILPYVMFLLKQKKINPRQALLLGYVDRVCNPYWKRHPEVQDRDEKDTYINYFRVSYLAYVLQCQTQTVNLIIKKTTLLRPKVLKATRKRLGWLLETRDCSNPDVPQLDAGYENSLQIDPLFLKYFQNEQIIPMDLFMLAKVDSFTRNRDSLTGNRKKCWKGNKRLAIELGVSTRYVTRIIHKLDRMRGIEIEWQGNRRFMRTTIHKDTNGDGNEYTDDDLED